MPKSNSYFTRLDKLRKRYYLALPGKESLIKLINESEVAEQVYNSNAIENSTLTLAETEKILLQINLDRYITEREIFEAKNLARVMEYIDGKAKDQDLTRETILLLHQMLIGNIRPEIAGRFRSGNEWVRVGQYIAPGPQEVEALIADMINRYHATAELSIITRIATLHLMFENAHPFCDGNGRIGRVINNYLLLREGYVPIKLLFADRAQYYSAFREFDLDRSISIMEDLVGKALMESYHKRLAYLEGKKNITLADYARQTKQSINNLINKANRQTIEAFREGGEWKIGVPYERRD